MNLNPAVVRQIVANLLLAHPELFDDEDSRALSIESETPAVDYLRSVEAQRREAECMAGAIASQIAQLELRQERFIAHEKACRQIAFKLMESAALQKLVMPEATYSITKGQRRVVITDENALPDIACRFKREPDKTKIKELLQTDPFYVAGATLSNAEPTLTVRTK